MTKQQFVEIIGKLAIEENNSRSKKVLPSICVAQACLESGYGQSELMMKYNAPFGIKTTGSWKGASYNAYTKEYYNNTPVGIRDNFRAYPDLESAVKDYYSLLTTSPYYADVVNKSRPDEAVQGLKAYATNPSYIKSVLKIINDNDFHKRFDRFLSDNITGSTPIYTVGSQVKIIPDQTVDNNRSYIFDKNGIKNRLWYDTYTIMQQDGSNILIGVNGVATCWINNSKIKEVIK